MTLVAVAGDPEGPRWTGFQNGGDLSIEHPLAERWSDSDASIAWTAAVEGYGQSSPVVWESQVFVTSTSGEHKEHFHVTALALVTGDKRWQRRFDNPSPVENSSYVSRAAPTPVVDSERVIALHEGGILVALTHDGQVLWQRDLVEEYGPVEARHGLAASLEQSESLAFVWIERSEEPYLLAVDKATGETVWKVPGLGVTSWSSPRLVSVGDGAHLVCCGSTRVVGFDADNGQPMWQIEGIAGGTTTTPVPVGPGRFLLGTSEASKGSADVPDGATGMVEIHDDGRGGFKATFVWRAAKAMSSFGTPLVTSEHVWVVTRAGVLYRLDAETGEPDSPQRIAAGSIWATPLESAGRVYLFGQKGTTSVLSTADASEIAVNTLGSTDSAEESEAGSTEAGTAPAGQVLYAVAAAPPYLLIRYGDRVVCIAARQR